MTKIVFPAKVSHRYYKKHADFIFKQAEVAGLNFDFIPYTKDVWFQPGIISILVAGHVVRINYSDHIDLLENDNPKIIQFKQHYNREKHKEHPNVFPSCPGIIFPSKIGAYHHFYSLTDKDLYQPELSEKIINKQKAYGNATIRRAFIKSQLQKHYKEYHDPSLLAQVEFWKELTRCLVAVHAPGARPDMIDRGLMEIFGLGVCAISPPITDVLSGYRDLIPGVHYIECQYDYKDLIGRIEWCRNNREKCAEIGANAKALFREVYPPHKYWQWIVETTKRFYR